MSELWLPGDIGVTTNDAFLDKLIKLGQRIHGDAFWKWTHAFIVIDPNGNTIEAIASGVKQSNVANHGQTLNLGCPDGVDRASVIACAKNHLNDDYSYTGDVLMGIDCLTRWKLHDHSQHSEFCSELAARALVEGGWLPPILPELTMPSTLVAEMGGKALLR